MAALILFLTITSSSIGVTSGLHVVPGSGPLFEVKPLTSTFGGVVEGISLNDESINDPAFTVQLEEQIAKHRLLVFRKNGISPQQQVDLARKLGDPSRRTSWPTDPEVEISRISNDREWGWREFVNNWHVHGTSMPNPFHYTVLYSVKAVPQTPTSFVALKELVAAQPADVQQKWRELTYVTETGRAHPLVYKHPYTGQDTMSFHLMPKGERRFIQNFLLPNQKEFDFFEMIKELTSTIERTGVAYDNIYSHEWEEGDLIIVDNLAVAHKGTDFRARKGNDGLRVLDTINIRGRPGNAEPEVGSKNGISPTINFVQQTSEECHTRPVHLTARWQTFVNGKCDQEGSNCPNYTAFVPATAHKVMYPCTTRSKGNSKQFARLEKKSQQMSTMVDEPMTDYSWTMMLGPDGCLDDCANHFTPFDKKDTDQPGFHMGLPYAKKDFAKKGDEASLSAMYPTKGIVYSPKISYLCSLVTSYCALAKACYLPKTMVDLCPPSVVAMTQKQRKEVMQDWSPLSFTGKPAQNFTLPLKVECQPGQVMRTAADGYDDCRDP